jgi:two-component system, chemotaxis family, chemotaxis protein CheY
MPNCDGIDLIRSLRKTPEYRPLPVIMLSGSGSDQLTDAKDAGANATLEKPVTIAPLLDGIEPLIENSATLL